MFLSTLYSALVGISQFVGAIALSSISIRIALAIAQHYLLPSHVSRFLHAEPHDETNAKTSPATENGDSKFWALITASSDTHSIGFGFAQELASHGFNIILHGRNESKLEHASRALRSAFPACSVKSYTADAYTTTSFSPLENLLKDVRLSVLINCVGGTGASDTPASKRYASMQDMTPEEVTATIDLNIRFTTLLTRTCLPHLLANQPSLLLNISGLGTLGFPGLSMYSGAKGYLDSWAEALAREMVENRHDVAVHAAVLGLVQSSTQRRETGFFVPSARELARSALGRVGKLGTGTVFVPWWPHAMQLGFLTWGVPGWLRTWMLVQGRREDERAMIEAERVRSAEGRIAKERGTKGRGS